MPLGPGLSDVMPAALIRSQKMKHFLNQLSRKAGLSCLLRQERTPSPPGQVGT